MSDDNLITWDSSNTEILTMTVAEFAEIAFNAQERVLALEMANTPTDYDERKKAFIALAEARAEAARAKRNLENVTT